MNQFNSYYKKNQKGFSIVEALVLISVTSIFLSGTIYLLIQAKQGQTSLQYREDVTDWTDEIKAALSMPEACTKNLKGLTLNMSKPDGESISVDLFDKNKALIRNVAKKGAAYGKLSMLDLRLKPEAEVTSDRLIGFIEAQYVPTNQHSYTTTFVRKIGVGIRLDASNKILDCAGLVHQQALSLTQKHRLCYLVSADLYFDVDSDQCQSRKGYNYFDGTATQANCPMGWERVSCKNKSTSCGGPSATRAYADGVDRSGGPPCVKADPDTVQSDQCNCVYASSDPMISPVFTSAQGICRAYCSEYTVSSAF